MRTSIQFMQRNYLILLLLLIAAGTKNNLLAQPVGNSGIALREGVVIEKVRKEIYITTPDNKVEALSLSTGNSLWTSTDKLKVLTLVNGKLVCQGNSSAAANDLNIVELDVAQKGSVKSRNSIQLPANVKSSFKQTSNASFTLRAKVINGQAYLIWDYNYVPMKGMYEENDKADESVKQSGIIMLNKTTGSLKSINKQALPKSPQNQSIQINQKDRIQSLKTQQFISKDEKYILSSEKVASDSVFNCYRWEIYERATGKKIGQIFDYRSYAPFSISDNIIIYDSGPYERLTKEGIRQVPLQIVAVDLKTGNELWSKAILDTVFRGLTPP